MTGRRAWPGEERTGAWPPLPDDFGVVLDPSTRRHGADTVTGGSPTVAARLTRAGAAVFDRLATGENVGAVSALDADAGAFARWLVDAGLAHPVPPQIGASVGVTVVIPVRDRAGSLEPLVASLADASEVIVVDDGSTDGSGDIARHLGCRVIRRERAGGPALARNVGMAQAQTELVAFIDSDCLPEPGWASKLARHFGDPMVAAAAPRIVALGADGDVGGYESARSVLDQGPESGRIDPFGPVTFVPSAALVVRRSVVTAAGGFEPDRHFGEDQDLVWRLASDGWRMRYDAGVRVAHDHRDSLGAFIRRRAAYGTPIASLAQQHPTVVTAARLPGAVAAALAVGAVNPVAGAATALGSGLVVGRRLRRLGLSPAQATRLAIGFEIGAVRTAAAAVTGPWLPVALIGALVSRRARLVLLALLIARHGNDWRRSGSPVGPLRHAALRIADDGALAAGRWWGAARNRTVRGLGAQLLPLPSATGAPLVHEAIVLR